MIMISSPITSVNKEQMTLHNVSPFGLLQVQNDTNTIFVFVFAPEEAQRHTMEPLRRALRAIKNLTYFIPMCITKDQAYYLHRNFNNKCI